MSALFATVRWLARLSSLVVAGGFVVLVAGEMLAAHSGPPTPIREWTGIALLTVACLGMLAAWRWGLPGAILSLVSLAVYTLLIQFTRHTVHIVLAIPGTLFLAESLLRHVRTPIPR